jgi:hypothetical protein
MEPRLPDTYISVIYIPVYSQNDGMQWQALRPCLTSSEAKRVLKSWMPATQQMVDDHRYVGLRIGCVGININTGAQFSMEFIPLDFVYDNIEN